MKIKIKKIAVHSPKLSRAFTLVEMLLVVTIIGILALFKGLPVIGPILVGIQLMLYVMATGKAATATGLSSTQM